MFITIFFYGIKKGIEQGTCQGIKEEKYSIARNLLGQNIDIEIISKSTGLSVDEIKKLQEIL